MPHQPERRPADSWHRISDVAVLSVGFVFVFMAFTVLQSMASTILAPAVAFKQLGALYVSFAFFNLFAAATVVEKLGCGASMFAASVGYSLFAVANVVALRFGDDVDTQTAILVPAAVITGLSAAVLWAAQGVYVTRCAARENVGKYTGIFFGVFWWASILGPLLTRMLLLGGGSNVDVFGKLTAVGACGPLVFLWLWKCRPEPGHPDVEAEVVNEDAPRVKYRFLGTFRIMFTRSMLLLAPLYYTTSVDQSFSSGSLPLFIKSGDPKVDLQNKLYFQACFGVSLMTTSFFIGRLTDRFGSRPLVCVNLFIHLSAMSVLWILKPINNLPVIFACGMVLAFSDTLLMNQIYKLLGTLYPTKSDTPVAFSAYKFHQSLGTGTMFIISKAMLGEDGVPNMDIWTPLLAVVLLAATVGVLLAVGKPVSRDEVVRGDSDESSPLLGNTVSEPDRARQDLERKRQTNRLGDVLTMAVAFFFIFSAFMVIQGLASSVLPKSVAFMTLGSLYFSFAFCNLFLAAPIVDWVGPRAALFLASITYSVFGINTVVALRVEEPILQLSVLVPAAVFNGFGAAVLWTAESVYITKCACKETIGRYAGYFFSFVGAANLAGPLFSSLLLKLDVEKIRVFEIMCYVGAIGPLLALYLMWRPAPGNPYDTPPEADSTSEESAQTATPVIAGNPLLKTFRLMTSSTILLIAPISYFGSCQMAFNGGSIPLFINTGNVAEDLSTKLNLVALMGFMSTVTSAAVGPFTDRLGPRVMLVFAGVVYSGAMGFMWMSNPLNDLWVLVPCVVLFTFCSGIVANQNYKMMGVLFSGTASAFAAQRFHSSLGTGVAFMTSSLMLTSEGIPNMNAWAPLIWGCLVAGTVGSFVVTRDRRFRL
ncbi:DUF895 domain membrane protein [Podochytrium sp. JEL0797]|nr:DUF895 domain membrane protein [Podochytrium sp. JEL0797]